MGNQETSSHEFHSEGPAREWRSPAGRDLSGMTLGDFQVDRLLGRGGMGEVYLARQVSLDRPVALKVLKPDLLSNPTYLARFEKEALSAAKLNHPNIVHIYSLGEFENLKYIAMEYVPGTNLKELLVRKGPPELLLAFSFMRQSAQAVAAAAEVGLVHRDIKPENLLLTRKGQLKVADFGLCRASSSSEAMALTQEGVTLGTPMYMSPEQVQGRELDPRSDLYSLGVTYYHMLAGVAPFTADNALALALKHVRDEPVSLAVHRPDLPGELVDLVMKMMAKAPSDRYQNAREVLRDLVTVRDTIQAAASTAALPAVAVDLPGMRSTEIKPRAPSRSLRQRVEGLKLGRRQLAALGVLALALGALLGVGDRAEDLLSSKAADATGPPGLWIADWGSIPAATTASDQYRRALLESPADALEAAWLAVPGRFPTDALWTSKAYIQLCRVLLRRGDDGRLDVLASELDASGNAAHAALARVARAGVAAIRGDAQSVLSAYDGVNIPLQDPALCELGLEAAILARRKSNAPGTLDAGLRTLQGQLAEVLQIQPLVGMGLIQLD